MHQGLVKIFRAKSTVDMSGMSTTRIDPNTAKRNEQILAELLKEEANKVCADCGQKGTRWASWNIGVFLCIRCGGLHRTLGTHISKIKSTNLDKWTDEQVESIRSKGNAQVNRIYNPHPERFPFPAFTGDQEQYIRDKYERKLFMDGASRFADASRASTTKTAYDGGDRFSRELQSLKEMGFSNADLGSKALMATNGNIERAVDYLVASKGASNAVAAPRLVEADLLGNDLGMQPTIKVQSPSITKAKNETPPSDETKKQPFTPEMPDYSSWDAPSCITTTKLPPNPAPQPIVPPEPDNPWASPASHAAPLDDEGPFSMPRRHNTDYGDRS